MIIASTIRHNSATRDGGGIAYRGSAPVLVASDVSGNIGGDIVAVT